MESGSEGRRRERAARERSGERVGGSEGGRGVESGIQGRGEEESGERRVRAMRWRSGEREWRAGLRASESVESAARVERAASERVSERVRGRVGAPSMEHFHLRVRE